MTINKFIPFYLLLSLFAMVCHAQDMVHPRENIVWAKMSVNTSSMLNSEWEKRLEKEKKKGRASLNEVKKIEKNIKEEKIWLQDMQAILDGKKPLGKGIAIRVRSAQQSISKYSKNHPVYCNLKNVLRIYERLAKGDPIGSYSCN